MLYRKIPNTDIQLSALGFGTMRFPLVENSEHQGDVEEEKAVEMLRYGIDNGINLIDTAYPYHDGQSEIVVGKALQDGYREKVYLSTKAPVAYMKSEKDFEAYLDEQLQKLQTDYLDFYLLHALNPINWDIVKNLDILTKLDKVIAEGKVRYPAFSFHGGTELFKEIIDAFHWTLTLVQYNYLDENYQAGREGVGYAAGKDVAVSVMEPLRGGRLAHNIPVEAYQVIADNTPDMNAAQLGLKWVLNQEEITTVLSGMSSLEQIQENVTLASSVVPGSMKEAEKQTVEKLKQIFKEKYQVDCTDCRYCLPCEPRNIAINKIFDFYNEKYLFQEEEKAKKRYQKLIEESRDGNRCIRCGACEKRCPQDIPIRELLPKIHRELKS